MQVLITYKPIPYFCEIKSRTIKVHVSWWLPNLQLQTIVCVSGSKHKAFGKQMVHEKHKLFQVFAPFCWSMKYEKTDNKCQGLHIQDKLVKLNQEKATTYVLHLTF